MNKNSRFNKWRKYRQDIDSCENLDFSIVNSNSELKDMFASINFDIESAYIKSGYKVSLLSNEHYKSSKITHRQEINKIINIIEKNEINNERNYENNINLNSHKNDEIINKYFQEFIDKKELEEQNNQETTNLKISKINIVESKEK
ncbi:MAG: hypothetical protein HDR43_00290 [Mycoplasma sp.]|nr:hypothetical protein [Mycoplasma sp.]